MRTHARPLAAVITLTVIAPAGAAAQAGRQLVERHTLEGYVARYALDDKLGTTTTSSFNGFGARLLLERFNPDRPATTAFARTSGGLFATYTTAQGVPSLTTLHVGLETDVMIPPQPLAGVVDPFISFGIGLFRTSRQNLVTTSNRK